MKYFRLLDDMTVPRRWHLGEVTLSDGTPQSLTEGAAVELTGPLTVEVTDPGRALDFFLSSFAVPIATNKVAQRIVSIAGPDVQQIPLRVGDLANFQALNATRAIACLDEERSEFVKWTREDHRADLAGQYRMVTKLYVDETRIPSDAHFFRIEGWLVALIVSDVVKAAMEAASCLGAKFIPAS